MVLSDTRHGCGVARQCSDRRNGAVQYGGTRTIRAGYPDIHRHGSLLERSFGELVTDSGLAVIFVLHGQPQPQIGERITISARKFRPVYQAGTVTKA